MRESASEDATYSVVQVTQANLVAVSAWPATGKNIALNWPGKAQSQGSRSLRPGDTVNLTIWDSQPNSLMTASEQSAVPMNGLVISPEGTIFVPYIDEVKIIGMSPEQARSDIQARLAVVPGDQNIIELVSGVQRLRRYPVASHGITIMSALAEGGGIPDGLSNPLIRLQGGGQSFAALAKDIYANPERDILLRGGGNRIDVEFDPRSFIILGVGSHRSRACGAL
ncbi:MAG: polysaccharide biosynthesis/export family protein [Rhodobacteraceae bacterium]|nr:polysaccharide biosynthesis/export family protein [Paracoccaceae bacterium]MCF8521022.1 polysaccharide biosynthesis/export family protein [Paracoccaceae bacterium]